MRDDARAALIALYRGLARQGPGDEAFARALLAALPPLPKRLAPAIAHPAIADFGCGSGAGALLLAEHYGAGVLAVDLAQEFLDELASRAKARGLASLIRAVRADFSDPAAPPLSLPPRALDLLWAEGSAYHLGFARALAAWRPFLAEGALAVVSDLVWFEEEEPLAARAFWAKAYPAMADEKTRAREAKAAGFDILFRLRLPVEAWWTNYYGPLAERAEKMRADPAFSGPASRAALAAAEEEIALFAAHSETYGYAYFALRRR